MAELKRFTTPRFRASFPHVFQPNAMDEGTKPRYSISAVWTPADFTDQEKALWARLMKGIDEACKEKFKKSLAQMKEMAAGGANVKVVPRNGAAKVDLEGYGEGTVFANLTSLMRPGIVLSTRGDDGKLIAVNEENMNTDEIYPGCYMRATVTIYAYDNKSKGVSLGLMNLQKVADGDRLDSRSDAASDFEESTEEEDLLNGDGSDDDEIPF